jgi:response regulator NasT
MTAAHRILIADDDPVIRMDLKAMLESIGHQVIAEADNGDDAVRMARRLKPSVAILDIVMPRLSGLEAAAAINKERIAPVLLLTGFSDRHLIEAARDAGALAYLVKPFRGPEIEPAIELAIARYRDLLALEGERDSLSEEMALRKLLGKARTALMRRHGITDREAMKRLNARSLESGKPLREVAEAVLIAEQLDPLDPS